jgi:hypothetical protein
MKEIIKATDSAIEFAGQMKQLIHSKFKGV